MFHVAGVIEYQLLNGNCNWDSICWSYRDIRFPEGILGDGGYCEFVSKIDADCMLGVRIKDFM